MRRILVRPPTLLAALAVLAAGLLLAGYSFLRPLPETNAANVWVIEAQDLPGPDDVKIFQISSATATEAAWVVRDGPAIRAFRAGAPGSNCTIVWRGADPGVPFGGDVFLDPCWGAGWDTRGRYLGLVDPNFEPPVLPGPLFEISAQGRENGDLELHLDGLGADASVESRSVTSATVKEPLLAPSAEEAAILAARRDFPGLRGLTATEIWRFPDESVHDRRLRVENDTFCAIYGAGGQRQPDGRLAWSAGLSGAPWCEHNVVRRD